MNLDAPSQIFTRRSLLRHGALLGAGSFAASWPFGSAFAQSAAADWPAVARLIDSYVASRRVAGMVAAMGFRQAAPAFVAQGKRGFDLPDDVGPDSLFRIYSMTKPITGMAAMVAIDEGLISLDQPLADILPSFARMQVQKVYDGPITPDNLEPAERQITIRHLLTHTAGLGYSIIQQGPIADAYKRNGLLPAAVSRMELVQSILGGPPAPTLAAFADRLATMPLVHQPGTKWSYSVSLDLLGRVIEVASGQPFDTFLQERLLDPIGMTSTFFRVPRSESGRLTTNYFLLGGMPLPVDAPGSSVFLDAPAFPFGGAGLVSSPRDYDRFLQMLAGWGEIDGRRVMREPAVRLATSNLFPATLRPNGGFSADGREFGYGAGGLVGRGDTAGLFGWFGVVGAAGLVNLRNGLRHNLMTQYMPAESYPVQREFPLAVSQDAAALAAR